MFTKLFKSSRGVTLVEYMLIISLMVMLAIGGLRVIGKTLSNGLNNIGNKVTNP